MPQQKTTAEGRTEIFIVKSDTNLVPVRPVRKSEQEAAVLHANQKQSTREWIIALMLLFAHVALTTGGAQMSNMAFTDPKFKFRAPFLFVLFKTGFRSLAFPIYLLVNTVVKLARGRPLDYRRTWKRCLAVCGEDLRFRVLLVKFLPATIFNLVVQITYTLGIQNLTASLASALTPPAVATSYIMAFLFLHNRIIAMKILFVLVAFAGVAVIAEGELRAGFEQSTVIGIFSMLLSDVCLSSYQLCFKKSFPKGDLGQVSFAVSGMYVLMLIIYLPVPIILNLTGVETYDITLIPYPFLVGSWSCSAVSALVYGYGIVVAGGFFMGLSDLLILASNSGIDVLRNLPIPTSQIIGTVIISCAFLILILPDRYISVDIRQRLERWGVPLPAWTWSRPRFFQRTKATDSQVTLASREESRESMPRGASNASLPISAIGEEDILENQDLHLNAKTSEIGKI
ncbi:hypothetical protein BV898_12777 [Hypsibius exemplaris]|uniref:Solute carrier family 35 member F4 n=1 Tax=Hypsibius exemplaris TaxID=2072580 RepID=A0A1W0WCP9_HYPEX|nr:hypothetical protein BV898_12777 [Hypsibius exemplaris]